MSSEKFIAIQVIADITNLTPEAREEIAKRIQAALGCDGTESPCVMESYTSTIVDDAEKAYNWMQ